MTEATPGMGTGAGAAAERAATGERTAAGERTADTGRTGTTATTGTTTPLLPRDECDKLETRLQHALSGFVDGPRAAVEEADRVLEEVAGRFTEAVSRRRRTLRGSWQEAETGEDKPASTTDTEQLRLALRDYRELAERLLRV
ncbi:hypothetical protein [Streptomyces sp. TRM68416]|uniref:hypothetical protein n=1 Tax=Streptomyces sp. TRM68416 TaxID=2758412 RepID=UPI001661C949|nr:hypothetical protein [Streptomyces sp. TRM68416]MBD0837346.1 hypothetical protein [Streptomyces sp. TRM68416]